MGRAAIMIILALCVVGCGRADRVARSTTPQCPEGTAPLTAKEVIGAVPDDYTVEPPARQKPIDQFVKRLRREMGGNAYRNHDASVIYDRGKLEGTVVVVVNTTEGRSSDAVAGAKAAEQEDGVQGEAIEVDGREARLQRATDGSYLVVAPAGDCSMLLLFGVDKPMLEKHAALIGARG